MCYTLNEIKEKVVPIAERVMFYER
jgi:hypothetical protein